MTSEQTFGDWTLLERKGGKALARCKCGTIRHVKFNDMRVGKSKGCGCAGREKMRAAARAAITTHGFGNSPTMTSWTEMKRRCYAAHRKEYPNYGGRGIYVCDRWLHSFANFLADMGARPDGHTLDRIDNNGPYSPENCRWVPRAAQERNKRSNVFYTFNGERMTVAEAAERYGINATTLYQRIGIRGWEPSHAVNTPVAPARGRYAKR